MDKSLLLPALFLSASLAFPATAHAEKAHRLQAPYDPAAHEVSDGTNVIQGNAFIPLKDGGTEPCNDRVTLLPVTPYTTERMMVTYDSDREGYRSARIQKTIHIPFTKRTRDLSPSFEPEPDHFARVAGRTARCDRRGDFEFSGVADGDYFVTTEITWKNHYNSPQGGALMARVSLRGGRTARVVLAP